MEEIKTDQQQQPTGKIYGALADIMSEIGAIEKSRENKQQGYAFRGIDDFLLASQPVFCKHRVVPTPEVLEHQREERVTKSGTTLIYSILRVRFCFTHADDLSRATCTTMGEGMDSGDKSINKAMSAALKYALIMCLLVPTHEGLKDSEDDSPEAGVKKPAGGKKAAKKEQKPPDPNAGFVYFRYNEKDRFFIPKLVTALVKPIPKCPWGKSKGKLWKDIEDKSLQGLWGVAHDILIEGSTKQDERAQAVSVLAEIDLELTNRKHQTHVEFETEK